MQTFMPYADFRLSLHHLDSRRLGKQRVESAQILSTLWGLSHGWKNHPAVKMWAGYEAALVMYYNTSLFLWADRGYKNIKLQFLPEPTNVVMPWWMGNNKFHSSHRAALLHKNGLYYSQFGWSEEPKLDYYWPLDRPE